MLTGEEYERLMAEIKAAEKNATYHAQRRARLARCVALLVQRAIHLRGLKLSEVAAKTGLRGSLHGVLMDYLRAGFGPDWQPDPVFYENVIDLLAALEQLEDAS